MQIKVALEIEMPNIAGNYFDKYSSRNWFHRILISGFLKVLEEMVETSKARTIFECGCGEGYLSLHLLKRGYKVEGCDLDQTVVGIANSRAESEGFGTPFHAKSIYDLEPLSPAPDLVMACEVLEHLEDPAAAVERIRQITAEWAIFSVPNEPIWRILNVLRLRYLARLGNTPGHIQHWTPRQFANLISKYFHVVDIRKPLPWTFLRCRKR
ncbi:MAG: class I SAM-dependent methyltransferase [Deltaproteobacteria bacterium]|nr:class I SAM-dependent methyltransferase [Deltaproteobacteria bacterium]